MVNKTGVGFIIPIYMQALYREADDYMVSLKRLMPSKFAKPMNHITAKHTAAWDATFAVYEPIRNPGVSKQYKQLSSVVMPVLKVMG